MDDLIEAIVELLCDLLEIANSKAAIITILIIIVIVVAIYVAYHVSVD